MQLTIYWEVKSRIEVNFKILDPASIFVFFFLIIILKLLKKYIHFHFSFQSNSRQFIYHPTVWGLKNVFIFFLYFVFYISNSKFLEMKYSI